MSIVKAASRSSEAAPDAQGRPSNTVDAEFNWRVDAHQKPRRTVSELEGAVFACPRSASQSSNGERTIYHPAQDDRAAPPRMARGHLGSP